MQLKLKQISKIYKKVELDNDDQIVLIDVSEDKYMPSPESNFNIYRVTKEYEIIWQIKEVNTKPIDDADMFVYVGMNNNGEIIADRYSGYEYKINLDTGEAIRIGFHK